MTAANFAPALAAVLLALAGSALAHSARTGWDYPFACCGGSDCAEIPAAWVRTTRSGFAVSIPPGGHPMWGADKAGPFEAFVPADAGQTSPDGLYHICLVPSAATSGLRVACFWYGGGGF